MSALCYEIIHHSRNHHGKTYSTKKIAAVAIATRFEQGPCTEPSTHSPAINEHKEEKKEKKNHLGEALVAEKTRAGHVRATDG